MKVALVHDYLKEYGGAERVLESLHEIYPDAPIFTTVYLPQFLGPHKERFKNLDIKTSFLQYIPFKGKFISIFRLFSYFAFKSFDFSNFDVIITSATGAYNPNILNKKEAKLVCYCHTPPRYLYGYATARSWKKNVILRILGELANHFLRMIDFKSAQNVDYFIANSKNVKGRIRKFYKKEAEVIYPPVDINSKLRSQIYKKDDSYFLTGGRLARPKHIDLIIETCAELGVKLKVFGKGFAGYEEELLSKKQSKVKFVGEVDDQSKLELMKNAKAYIFASEDEDFGITPVEAMGVGTPVIAYRSGGVVESILDGKTGLFFDSLTIENLGKAIRQFENIKINPIDCTNQAKKFSKERFKREIINFVKSKS